MGASVIRLNVTHRRSRDSSSHCSGWRQPREQAPVPPFAAHLGKVMGLPAHRAWWQLWHQPPALPQPLLVVGNGACAHLGHSLRWGLSKGWGVASNKCFLMHFLDEAEKAFRVKIV